MRRLHLVRLGLAAVTCVLLAACGGSGGADSGASAEPIGPAPTTVGIVGPTRVENGEAGQWRAQISPAAADAVIEWNFGDGSAPAPGAVTDHRYAASGAYTLTLSVTLPGGERRVLQQALRVGAFARLEGANCSGPDRSGWCWQSPAAGARDLMDALFIDDRQGWAVGPGPTLLATRDGGATWAAQAVPAASQPADGADPALDRLDLLRFADALNGIAASLQTGRLLRTGDGGGTWSAVDGSGLSVLSDAWMPDARTLVLSGRRWTASTQPYGEFVSRVSTDGGLSWRDAAALVTMVTAGPTLWQSGRQSQVSRDLGLTFQDVGPPAPAPASPFVTMLPPPMWKPLRSPRVDDTELLLQVADIQSTGADWLLRLLDQGRTAIDAVVQPPLPALTDLQGMGSTDGGELWASFRTAPLYDSSQPFRSDWQRARSSDGGQHWQLVGDVMQTRGYGTLLRLDRKGWLLASGEQRAWIFADGDGLAADRDLPEVSTELGDARRSGQRLLLGFGVGGPGSRWYTAADAGAPWKLLPGGQPYDGGLWNVGGLWFFDGRRGLAISEQGWARSDDGGRHWVLHPVPADKPNVSLHFTRDGVGWGVREGKLLRSADRGATWQARSTPAGGEASVAQFIDGQRGWLTVKVYDATLGWKPELHFTPDGGSSWQPRALPPPSSAAAYGGVVFADELVGMSTGYDEWTQESLYGSTTDGGKTWTRSTVPAKLQDSRADPPFVLDAGHAWMLRRTAGLRRDSHQADLFFTADGGKTWTERGRLPARVAVYGLAFADADNGWAVGSGGLVLRTRDGGRHWEVQPTQASGRDLTVVTAVDAHTAWIGGVRGTIVSTSTGGD
ncbi:MAG: hypothetical protein LCI02_07680 [Proteobacteria bacterium]|nr:hypothetical protein [Pseudomonadota bacterium]